MSSSVLVFSASSLASLRTYILLATHSSTWPLSSSVGYAPVSITLLYPMANICALKPDRLTMWFFTAHASASMISASFAVSSLVCSISLYASALRTPLPLSIMPFDDGVPLGVHLSSMLCSWHQSSTILFLNSDPLSRKSIAGPFPNIDVQSAKALTQSLAFIWSPVTITRLQREATSCMCRNGTFLPESACSRNDTSATTISFTS